MVKTLVETGKFVPHEWLASPIITQVLWGALFCLPFGFSFEALVISTLTLSFITSLFTYLILKRITNNNLVAFLSALLIIVNPIFFNLSVTFMMDIPFYAFFVVSIYFYIVHIQTNKEKYLWVGAAAALLSLFIRQYGLIIPLSFLILEIINRRTILHRKVLIQTSVFLLFILAYSTFNRWLNINERMSDNYRQIDQVFNMGLADLGWRIFTRSGHLLLAAGLWLFPFLLSLTFSYFSQIKKAYKPILVISIILIAPMIRVAGEIPSGNILYDLGLGPLTTSDVFIFGDHEKFSVPWIWYFIVPISFTGALMLIMTAVTSIAKTFSQTLGKNTAANVSKDDLLRAGGVILIILYLGITMINFTYFDRYILPLLILLMIVLMPADRKMITDILRQKMVYLIFIGMFLLFGILGTRYYLEWNRVRWMAANNLIREGNPASSIDAGHEFNGWHGATIDVNGKWDTSSYEYVIGFSELPGYELIKTYPIQGVRIFPVNEIHVLRKPE